MVTTSTPEADLLAFFTSKRLMLVTLAWYGNSRVSLAAAMRANARSSVDFLMVMCSSRRAEMSAFCSAASFAGAAARM